MSAEWTPGPWVADPDGSVRRSSGESWDFIEIISPWAGGAIDADDPEVAANMRLIAAAPELYEALLHARLVLEAYACRAGEKFRNGMIDAAIAKARGDA